MNFTEHGFPKATSMQRALLHLVLSSNYVRDLVHVRTLMAKSQVRLDDFRIISLPNDQWKREVLGWEREVWASLQILISNYAIGPSVIASLTNDQWVRPQTEGEKALCGAQKMKKSGEFV